jgi:hypothetical protein
MKTAHTKCVVQLVQRGDVWLHSKQAWSRGYNGKKVKHKSQVSLLMSPLQF